MFIGRVAIALALLICMICPSPTQSSRVTGEDNNGDMSVTTMQGGGETSNKDQSEAHQALRLLSGGEDPSDFEEYYENSECRMFDGEKGRHGKNYIKTRLSHKRCHRLCKNHKSWCMGYEFGGERTCELWLSEPKETVYKEGSVCAFDD
jgi:hypothetical protein